MYQADLDSPREDFSVRGLGFVVALSVRWQVDFCVRPPGIQPLFMGKLLYVY